MASLTQRLPISPELYQKTLEQMELRTVCLEQVEAVCERSHSHDGLIDISLGAHAEDGQQAGAYFAFITYKLRGQRGGTALLCIDAKYRLHFDAPEPVPDGFFEVFQDLNLRMTTMPYFRELVASITGRMELPTLTLPYAIYAAPDREEDGQQDSETSSALPDQKVGKGRQKKRQST